MRNALLRRLTTGFIAAATVVSMFAGLSLTTSAADGDPKPINTGSTLKVTAVTVDGSAVADCSGLTASVPTATSGVIAIPYVKAGFAAGDTISVKATVAVPAGSYLTGFAAEEVLSTGAALTSTTPATAAIFNESGNLVPTSLAHPQYVAADMKTGTQEITFTFSAINAPTADGTLYAKLSFATEAMSSYVFWSSVTGRRQIPLSQINDTDKTITVYYDQTTVPDLWSIKGDALPTITVGKLSDVSVAAGKNIKTADQSTDYVTGTNAKDGDKVKLPTEYAVKYVVIPAIPLITNATLTNADLKKKTAYSMTLSIGGADYTLNKDTTYTADIITADATPVITFKNVTSLTGTGTVTFKGTYLYADQAFTVTTAALTSSAGAIVSLVYRDGTTQTVVVKADAAAVTASSVAYFSCTEQTGTDAIADAKKRVTILVGGTKNTAYPRALSLNAGLDTLTINLVNDTLPANMQVKLECKYIAGGTKTMDIKYYDQVFPVELTDGSYAFFSVVVKCIKNDILPVTSFDLMGYSTNLNFFPLSTWDQTTTALNKIIYFDLTGVLTDKTINSGVLADGTTDKIYPSTSFLECVPTYKDAKDFSITWKINGTLGGTVVKYTRPTITFDVTDPTTNLPISYTAVLITSKAAINVVATNTTLGGQVAVATTAGEYSQKWKQADAYTQFAKDGNPTKTKGTIDLTAYYYGPKSLDTDYITMAIRLPRGCTLTIDDKASGEVITGGSIKMFTLLQNWTGTVGNTTTDGCIDYILKLQYREFNESGSATGAANTLKIAYPLKNKDGKSASATSFKEYTMTTTWVKKAYSGEKKVTMAGVTVPDAIVAPSSSADASSVPATTSTTTSTTSTSSTASLPTNPPMGVPFNALAYVVTIAASAIGGVSTMIIRKK